MFVILCSGKGYNNFLTTPLSRQATYHVECKCCLIKINTIILTTNMTLRRTLRFAQDPAQRLDGRN